MQTLRTLLSLILLTLALSACTLLGEPEFRGAVYAEPAPPPDFSLPATTGGTFTLSEQTEKVILLFFGYTYCPDICPATIGTLKTALNQLSDAERAQITVVVITVDPERDTLDQLRRYLDTFNAGFIGVVPSLEELAVLKSQYGVVADKDEIQADGSYTMSHTGVVYGINRNGDLQVGFFHGTPAEDIAHDLRLLLNP